MLELSLGKGAPGKHLESMRKYPEGKLYSTERES